MHKKRFVVNKPPSGDIWDSFYEPRTIPAGWDVAAFYTPQQKTLRGHKMMADLSKNTSLSKTTHEHTKDSI